LFERVDHSVDRSGRAGHAIDDCYVDECHDRAPSRHASPIPAAASYPLPHRWSAGE